MESNIARGNACEEAGESDQEMKENALVDVNDEHDQATKRSEHLNVNEEHVQAVKENTNLNVNEELDQAIKENQRLKQQVESLQTILLGAPPRRPPGRGLKKKAHRRLSAPAQTSAAAAEVEASCFPAPLGEEPQRCENKVPASSPTPQVDCPSRRPGGVPAVQKSDCRVGRPSVVAQVDCRSGRPSVASQVDWGLQDLDSSIVPQVDCFVGRPSLASSVDCASGRPSIVPQMDCRNTRPSVVPQVDCDGNDFVSECESAEDVDPDFVLDTLVALPSDTLSGDGALDKPRGQPAPFQLGGRGEDMACGCRLQ